MLRLWLLVIGYALIGCLLIRQHTAKLVGREVPPDQIRAGLGRVNVDGTLWLSYEIFRFPDLGISLKLVHDLNYDAFGRARSRWIAEGIKSSLIPHGESFLRWRSTEGFTMEFDRRSIGPLFSHAGAPDHEIRSTQPGTYVIRDGTGREWTYVDGCLTAMAKPNAEKLTFASDGDRIRTVSRFVGQKALPVIQVSYSPSGDITELRFAEKVMMACRWEAPQRLSVCTISGKLAIQCEYEAGLLSRLAEGNRVMDLTWQKNRQWFRAASGWLRPARLTSFGPSHYDYHVDQRGYAIEERSVGAPTQTVFNPTTGLVFQRFTGGAWVFCKN